MSSRHPLFAGIGGHQRSRARTNEWATPRHIIPALGGWESFDLDPCAMISQPVRTARRVFTAADNGLLMAWSGRVWLNPPYSPVGLLRRFLARLALHGQGTALIFARTETAAFRRYVWGEATALRFIFGRLDFLDETGEPFRRADGREQNAGAPSVLIAYGWEDADRLAGAGEAIPGQFIALRVRASVLGAFLSQTWADALAGWFAARGGAVRLDELYEAFARHPKATANPNFQAKIRQELQRGSYRRVSRGVWAKGNPAGV